MASGKVCLVPYFTESCELTQEEHFLNVCLWSPGAHEILCFIADYI